MNMTSRSITLVAFVVAGSVSGPALSDHGTNFHCSDSPFSSSLAENAIDRLSHNKTMKVIVKEYAFKWEVEEIRKVCDAAASGKDMDLSCYDGRRNWSEIEALIPDELSALDRSALRPHQLEIQKQNYGGSTRREALKYCESLGVIDLKVRK